MPGRKEWWDAGLRYNGDSEIEFLCAFDLTYVPMCLKNQARVGKRHLFFSYLADCKRISDFGLAEYGTRDDRDGHSISDCRFRISKKGQGDKGNGRQGEKRNI